MTATQRIAALKRRRQELSDQIRQLSEQAKDEIAKEKAQKEATERYLSNLADCPFCGGRPVVTQSGKKVKYPMIQCGRYYADSDAMWPHPIVFATHWKPHDLAGPMGDTLASMWNRRANQPPKAQKVAPRKFPANPPPSNLDEL